MTLKLFFDKEMLTTIFWQFRADQDIFQVFLPATKMLNSIFELYLLLFIGANLEWHFLKYHIRDFRFIKWIYGISIIRISSNLLSKSSCREFIWSVNIPIKTFYLWQVWKLGEFALTNILLHKYQFSFSKKVKITVNVIDFFLDKSCQIRNVCFPFDEIFF